MHRKHLLLPFIFWFASLLLCGNQARAQSAVFTKDINPGTGSSNSYNFTPVNNTLFLIAYDDTHGHELWKSDGTAAGTVLVKDIHAGTNGSSAQNLTNINGTLFFTASDATNGQELWKSDGTMAGTVLVKDIITGITSSSPSNLTNVNGTLFFSASDATHGYELWKSDGTAAGTVLVKDINTGNQGSSSQYLTNVNGTLFFIASDGTQGQELWKSDGTAAGTVLVKDIYAGTFGSRAQNLTNINGTLFFSASDATNGQELWKSDGTTAGTVLVKDIYTGTQGSSPQYLTNVNGTVFFTGSNAPNGQELWKSDGTTAGTVLVKDIEMGTGGSGPDGLTNVNGILFFGANESTSGSELWKSDGTAAGTGLVKDIFPGAENNSFPYYLTNVNGTLYFAAYQDNTFRIFKSDGTSAGTVMVQNLNSGIEEEESYNLASVNNVLFFTMTDATYGQELYSLITQAVLSVSITSSLTSPTNSTAIPVTFTFSKDVSGFEAADIVVTNGTLSNFTAVSGSTYTAHITPTATGTITVNVAAEVAQDATGVKNKAATEFSLVWDATAPAPPVLTSISDDNGLSASDRMTKDRTLILAGTAEPGAKVALRIGGVSMGTATSNATTGAWTFDYTATSLVDGMYVFTAIATDAAGNASASSTDFVVTVDNVAPSAPAITSITEDTGSSSTDKLTKDQKLVFGGTAEANAKVEIITNVMTMTMGPPILGPGGVPLPSIPIMTMTPTVVGTVTADANGNWTFDYTATTLAAGATTFTAKATDPAGNASAASADFVVTIDITAPATSISSTKTSPTNSNSIPVTITFQESVTGFDGNGITVTNGTQSGFTAVSGTTYTANITPASDGAVTVQVAANVAQDAAGNGNTAASQFSILSDRMAPAAPVITSITEDTGNSSSDAVTTDHTLVLYGTSEPNTKITLTVDGSTLLTLATSNGSGNWTFDYSATSFSEGEHIVTATATDVAGNTSASSANFPIKIDVTGPTVNLSSTASPQTGLSPFPVKIDFNEDVTGFDLADITLVNGVAANLSGSGKSYTVEVTPVSEGTVTANVAGSVAKDLAGNNNSAASPFSITYVSRPGVVISSSLSGSTNSATIPLTITFSSEVTGFEAADMVVTNGTQADFSGSGKTYSVNITPSAEGTVTVAIPENVAQDADSRQNVAASVFRIVYDHTQPTVALTSIKSSPTNSATIPVTITFSESVTGFVLSDVVITGGTGAGFAGSGKDYTLDVTPSADGTLTVAVSKDIVVDEAGNTNTAATQWSIVSDRTAPNVVLGVNQANPAKGAAIPVTITFSESVTDFQVNDIHISSGTKGNFSGSGTSYTLEVTPSTSGVITIEVAAGVAEDNSTNPNAAAEPLSINYNAKVKLSAIGNQSVNELALLTFTATTSENDEVPASASDNTSLGGENFITIVASEFTYALAGDVPSGAVIDPSTGVFTWTPTEAQGPKSYSFQVKTMNANLPEYSDNETITVVVKEVNIAPEVTSTVVITGLEDQRYAYTIAAMDADLPANTLTYAATQLPAWLSFDATTRTLSGTPDNSQVGTHAVTLTVHDGSATTEQAFTVQVANVNDAPVISSISASTSDEDQVVSISFEVEDVDNELASLQLKATAANTNLIPVSGISFSGSGKTRTLQFVPVKDAFGGPMTMTVEVSDGALSASTAFDVTIRPVNDAPVAHPVDNRQLRINSPSQTVLLTGISAGPANETGQAVSLSVAIDNPGLITSAQIVNNNDGTATLTYSPVMSQTMTGTTGLVVTLKDNGGTERGGVDAAELRFDVQIMPTNNSLFIPNLFSPNGNTNNEVFTVLGEGVSQITFRVFNKLGVMVYESSSVEEATTQGWDGTYQGKEQPAGVYTWQVLGSFADGSPLQYNGKKSGSVLLTR